MLTSNPTTPAKRPSGSNTASRTGQDVDVVDVQRVVVLSYVVMVSVLILKSTTWQPCSIAIGLFTHKGNLLAPECRRQAGRNLVGYLSLEILSDCEHKLPPVPTSPSRDIWSTPRLPGQLR